MSGSAAWAPIRLLLNAAQTMRPGRGAWRNLLDVYGAADILVAEVMVHRLYPGGPAQARFIGRHGPDGEIVGGFSMTAPNSAALPQMMAQGVQRMDRLFADAFAAGMLQRDPTLNQPPPPPPPPEEEEEEKAEQDKSRAPEATSLQISITAMDAVTYNSAYAHLRTIPGMQSVSPINVAIGNVSNFAVSYRGNVDTLRAALAARGWGVDTTGGGLRLYILRQPATPRRPLPAAADRPAAAADDQRERRGAVNKPRRPDRAAARLAADAGRHALHPRRREPRGVRAFPQVEHVAGQGDAADRAAAVGPKPACAELRRAGRRAA